MKRAILVPSFGTTKDETQEKNFAAIEQEDDMAGQSSDRIRKMYLRHLQDCINPCE